MAHITLSIPDELYEEIKRHKEIKWSEIARRSIAEEVEKKKGVVKGADLFNKLPEETKEGIREIAKFSKSDWKKFHKKRRRKNGREQNT